MSFQGFVQGMKISEFWFFIFRDFLMKMVNVMKMVMKMNKEEDEEKGKKLGVGGLLLDIIDFTRFNGLDFNKIIK
jgi:hypothetical protein